MTNIAPPNSLLHVKTVLLTTYRRNGEPVAIPVSIAFDGDRTFFRTWDTAGKARRLRANDRVEVAPSTLRGKQTGTAIRGRAKLLQGDDVKLARHALASRHPALHGFLVPLAHRVMRYRTLHYELFLQPD